MYDVIRDQKVNFGFFFPEMTLLDIPEMYQIGVKLTEGHFRRKNLIFLIEFVYFSAKILNQSKFRRFSVCKWGIFAGKIVENKAEPNFRAKISVFLLLP